MIESVCSSLSKLRATAPLIHNITNYVVMNSTANTLLAVGASPAMVHSVEEVEEFAGLASALVINIGTLSPGWVAAMKLAADRAAGRPIPWVLDPVAAGATAYRTTVARALADRRPAVIRGNASEILALAGAASGPTKGADSTDSADAAIDAARALAQDRRTVVAVTGAVDYVTDGERLASVANGSALMTRVTGTGCAATALIAAFLSVEPDPLAAATQALTVFGVAGEMAADRAEGPGTLQVALLDALHRIDSNDLARMARLS